MNQQVVIFDLGGVVFNCSQWHSRIDVVIVLNKTNFV